MACLKEVGPQRCARPKEDEDEEISEAEVGEGIGAAGVGIAEKEGEADEEGHGSAALDDEGDAEERGESKRSQDSQAHRGGGDESGSGDALGPDAMLVVRALEKVEVVIGEVGADLDAERGEEGKEEQEGVRAMFLEGKGAPDENGA